jgi:glutathione synthase/RimK-type ligase-like ATP-grasp enzyme
MNRLRRAKQALGGQYAKWSLDRKIPSMPSEAIVPLETTDDVLLLCSRLIRHFEPQIYVAELAFAQEMASRARVFAVAADPSELVDKSVVWFLPARFITPRLWDYSQQVQEFAAGLERQGNRLFCSSYETLFWENKAIMHRKLDEIGVSTPRTKILTAKNWQRTEFDLEPTLIKEEHSAGSSGIHYFPTAASAQRFVSDYRFRPHESLIMQAVVRGATKDLRLTMVGDKMIRSATFWRKRGPAASQLVWTTTATKYGSVVEHGNIPDSIVGLAAGYLRKLNVRTAGIDFMWVDDDLSREPLLLEFSPYYQPNPPKPARYERLTYRQYKARPFAEEGYLAEQYDVFREIAGQILDQKLI